MICVYVYIYIYIYIHVIGIKICMYIFTHMCVRRVLVHSPIQTSSELRQFGLQRLPKSESGGGLGPLPGVPLLGPRFPLKGSFKGDIGICIDMDI